MQDIQNGNMDYTEEEYLKWYEEDKTVDGEKIRRLVTRKREYKKKIQSDIEHTHEENITRVSETFPGIVITHFCKNIAYKPELELSFPLGFYVFWEMIVRQMLDISKKLGCKYVYLFAADKTEPIVEDVSKPEYLFSDVFEDDEYDIHISSDAAIRELVDYYKNEFSFEEVVGVRILKPVYDDGCFSLLQRISELEENRKAAWIRHSDMEDDIGDNE